jgi:hypothetical protein
MICFAIDFSTSYFTVLTSYLLLGMDRFIRPHRQNTRPQGFWKAANGAGSDSDEADPEGQEDRSESQVTDAPDDYLYSCITG